MSFSRRKIVNQLTTAINKGATLNEVLQNPDLSNSILYEVEELINFIFPPDEMKKPKPKLPNLDELIRLSMEPDSDQLNKYPLYPLSRNASSLLSSPSKKIHEKLREDNSKRFFKSLRKFIFSDYNQNIMFAGHFQRMFETALQKSKKELLDKSYNDNFESNFIPFIIRNSHLLPYRELLTTIMSEYSDSFPDSVDETLRFAAISTLHFREAPKELNAASNDQIQDQHDKKKADSLEKQKNTSLEKIIQDQPINCKHDKIPIPYHMSQKFKIKSTEVPNDTKFIDKLKGDLKFDDLNYNDLSISSKETDTTKIDNTKWIRFSLNLIYAVKNAFESSTNNFLQKKVDKDEKDNKESNVIRCLLVCGMYADSNSSLSFTSFNLLFNLLNKPHMDSDEMYDDKYILNLQPPKIIDDYAKHFVFDPYDVSEKMISALLVFWNHPYKVHKSKKEKAERRRSFSGYEPRDGVTPLRILLPTILTEPIFSSKLNNIFMRIISSMEQEIIDTINEEMTSQNQSKKDFKIKEERCFILDSIWYELLTYKFKLLPDDNEEITLQKALEKLLALPTTDNFFKDILLTDNENSDKYFRAPTNPVIFMLSKSINHGPFFSFKKGLNFRKILTEPYNYEWVQQTITYCHIIDRMEKQLINTPYERSKKKRLVVDEATSDDEMDIQSLYADKLTSSGRFKVVKKSKK